jgi:transcriptional regulator with XRE-family HTH domain
MTPADLKARRASLGLTQAALAAILGVSVITVSRWERGDSPILPYLALALDSIRRKRKAL